MSTRDRTQTGFEVRFAGLEAKEEIRSVLIDLGRIVDEGLLSGLSKLEPRLHAGFSMRVVDIAGVERRYLGARGLVDGYAPIMASGRGRLLTSAVSVELDGNRAMASFKLAGAVKSSPELGLPTGQTVLLASTHTAKLQREGGIWKLASLELIHMTANPEMEQPTARASSARRASASQPEAMPKAAKKTRSRGKRAAK